MAQTAALPVLSGETGLTRYLEEIRRFPMLEPQEEFMLAKRWREHGDRDAAHRLVTSHLRLVAKIAMGYRGYGLPISEVISEGNVGLMQAVKRFEPDKGFRLATYAMWWIKAAIQEYILRSWSLVKMGTTANQKKLFFNLRKAKSRISALDEGDMRPDQVKLIAKRLGVTEQDVIDMNRRLGGDASLNAPIREDGDSGEWMDWLVDDSVSQESRLAESEQSENRHKALGEALTVLNDRERRIFEARRLADEPITLQEALVKSINTVAASLADEVGRPNVANTARRLGIVTPISTDPAMALGASLVTPLEMAQAYDAFSNGGNRVAAYGIERIRTGLTGRVIWTHPAPVTPPAIGNPALGELNQMLRQVVAAGTGVKAAIPGYDIAGKTGTTSDFKDAWFCGFSGDFTTVVWMGRDDNSPMRGITGGSAPAEFWRSFMRVALKR
ncbi:MAG TPA: RNA polymerase sigma factor RpoH, partial [Xanthobacteraceae bacterium]|nr:RNA polymerase sigma factor RpoH [Xanthobacteraceae bacterium]